MPDKGYIYYQTKYSRHFTFFLVQEEVKRSNCQIFFLIGSIPLQLDSNQMVKVDRLLHGYYIYPVVLKNKTPQQANLAAGGSA